MFGGIVLLIAGAGGPDCGGLTAFTLFAAIVLAVIALLLPILPTLIIFSVPGGVFGALNNS
jgi:hypothetical protein